MSRVPSVLVTKKSEAKSSESKGGDRRKKRKPPEDQHLNDTPSPFPLPFATDNADGSKVIWPLYYKNSQPFFVGKLNRAECTVDIYDPPTAECLHRMGFFGKSCLIHQNLYQLRPIKPVNQTLTYPDQEESSKQSSLKRLNNIIPYKVGCKKLSDSPLSVKQKQWYSLYRAFTGTIPTKEHIIKGLYGLSTTSDSHAATLSIACGFDTGSYLYCELDGASNDTIYSDTSSDNGSRNDDFTQDTDKLLQATGNQILRLTLEEAFFLSYGLSILNVYDDMEDETAKPLNLEKMWKTFNTIYDATDETRFLAFYSAYHFFRSRGWIVGDGFKFGCDMVIYKEGPPYYHSLFSLTVIPIQGRNNLDNSPVDWQQICGKVRVSRTVHKEPTLCYVILPEEIGDVSASLPNLIEKVNIKCVHLERWPATKSSDSNVEGDNDSDQ